MNHHFFLGYCVGFLAAFINYKLHNYREFPMKTHERALWLLNWMPLIAVLVFGSYLLAWKLR